MRNATLKLFLAGDVMTGRGIDQILPHPSEPQLFEPWVQSAQEYVALAERRHGPILRPVDCCTLANNHVPDRGEIGLLESLRTLHRHGISVAGAGRNAAAAAAPAVIDVAPQASLPCSGAPRRTSGEPGTSARISSCDITSAASSAFCGATVGVPDARLCAVFFVVFGMSDLRTSRWLD